MQLETGDYMLTRTKTTIGKLIRFRCMSITNHAQPVYIKDGEAYVLNAQFPRMTIETLDKWNKDGDKKILDHFICSPIDGSEVGSGCPSIDLAKYRKESLDICGKLYEKRPFYDVISIFKYLITLPIASRSMNLMIDLAKKGEKIGWENVIHPLSQEHIRFCLIFDRMMGSKMLICTETWQTILLRCNIDIAYVFGGKFTPKESEQFAYSNCQYKTGILNGVVGDGLWKMVSDKYDSLFKTYEKNLELFMKLELILNGENNG